MNLVFSRREYTEEEVDFILDLFDFLYFDTLPSNYLEEDDEEDFEIDFE